MTEYQEFKELPVVDGGIPDAYIPGRVQVAQGLLVSQNGDDLTEVLVHLFFGPDPAQGSLVMPLKPEQAQTVAEHILQLVGPCSRGVNAREANGGA